MNLILSSYTNYTFNPEEYNIPGKLLNYYLDNLKINLFPNSGLLYTYPDFDLWITLKITDNVTNKINVTKPRKGKQKFSALIEFPYNIIDQTPEAERNKIYTQQFFEGLAFILQRFKVSETEVFKIRDEALAEIKANPEKYQLHELEIKNRQYVRESRAEYLKKQGIEYKV